MCIIMLLYVMLCCIVLYDVIIYCYYILRTLLNCVILCYYIGCSSKGNSTLNPSCMYNIMLTITRRDVLYIYIYIDNNNHKI